MWHTRWRSLAAASLLLAGLGRPVAARPVYGGTIRVETRADSLDPAKNFLLDGLVYEQLTRFADSGELVPELATAWHQDEGSRRWRFELRPNVRFQDGSAMDAAAIVAILQPMNPSWRWSTDGDAVVATLDQASPQFPAELAQPAFAIRKTGSDGLPLATGPFRIAASRPGIKMTLAANPQHWLGRPFVEAIEVALGRTLREQALAFELRRADLVELSPAELRRAGQSSRTVSTSLPKQLIALRLADRLNPEIRRALALSIDRASMLSVLLQRQGEVTAALLPQWLSGYAFLFRTAPDSARARQILAASHPAPVTLWADPEDPLLRSIADRIAVNARDVGLTVRVVTAQPHLADSRMARIPVETPSPRLALAAIASALNVTLPAFEDSGAQSVYAAESRLLESNLVVPLFHLPQAWLWAPRVRVWLRPLEGSFGTLNLADAWILEEKARP